MKSIGGVVRIVFVIILLSLYSCFFCRSACHLSTWGSRIIWLCMHMKLTGEVFISLMHSHADCKYTPLINTLPSLMTIAPLFAGLQGIFIAPVYFPFYSYLVLWKDDCQWTHGSLEKDRKSLKDRHSLKDPEKYMAVSNMHSLMNPFCWTVDHHRPHNTKSKWVTVRHHFYSMVAHTCSAH